MKSMGSRHLWFCWLGVVLLVLASPFLARAAAPSLTVSPAVIDIGTFFEGAPVTVSGEIPQGARAVLEGEGQPTVGRLLRKGRRGGLWMNVGEIQVQHAPTFYLVLSTAPDLLAAGAKEAPWGYQALQQRVKFSGLLQENEHDRFFREFLELKESDGLYGMAPGGLKITPGPAGKALVRGTMQLPAKIVPGAYRVRLSVIPPNGGPPQSQEASLQVRMVGFPAMLSALAYEHGGLYGILAVVIAIITGFVMGYLFKGKAAH